MVGFGDYLNHAAEYVGSGQLIADMGRDLHDTAERVSNMGGGSGSSGQDEARSRPKSDVVSITPFMSIGSIKPKDSWNIWAPQKTSPIHEIQTLAALAHSDAYPCWIFSGTTISEEWKTDLREVLRGTIWNDDPVCHLFHDNVGWNFDRKQGYVASFGADYLGFNQAYNSAVSAVVSAGSWNKEDALTASVKASMPSLTQRSHDGDMQFLHCMAQEEGETVQTTVRKVMCWCEAMYNIAIGEFSESRQLASINLPWFNEYTTPRGRDTVRTLFAGNTPSYPRMNVSKRALGSVFHVIQDSYAKGHCKRNPPFRGPIEQCHTFTGQDHERHSDLDHSSKEIEKISLANLDSFNDWEGVRPGIDACIKLAKFWHQKKPFDDGVRGFLRDEVFAIASDAKAADSSL